MAIATPRTSTRRTVLQRIGAGSLAVAGGLTVGGHTVGADNEPTEAFTLTGPDELRRGDTLILDAEWDDRVNPHTEASLYYMVRGGWGRDDTWHESDYASDFVSRSPGETRLRANEDEYGEYVQSSWFGPDTLEVSVLGDCTHTYIAGGDCNYRSNMLEIAIR